VTHELYFHKVYFIMNKMIPILLFFSMAVQVSQSEICDIRNKTEQI